MEPHCDSALTAMEAELRERLNIQVMFPHLEKEAGGFLTLSERRSLEDTNRNKGCQEAISELINMLRQKGRDAFDKFCGILDKTGQKVRLERLRLKADEIKSSSKLFIWCLFSLYL
jgi:hypothetical protein